MAVPLSFGLIMCKWTYILRNRPAVNLTTLCMIAPWGGHSVFPNIYRDMRHPHKYGKSLWMTYSFTVTRKLFA